MKKQDLIDKVARLESINDQLVSELQNLEALLKKIGFAEGIRTLKAAAQELLEEQNDFEEDNDDDTLAG